MTYHWADCILDPLEAHHTENHNYIVPCLAVHIHHAGLDMLHFDNTHLDARKIVVDSSHLEGMRDLWCVSCHPRRSILWLPWLRIRTVICNYGTASKTCSSSATLFPLSFEIALTCPSKFGHLPSQVVVQCRLQSNSYYFQWYLRCDFIITFSNVTTCAKPFELLESFRVTPTPSNVDICLPD